MIPPQVVKFAEKAIKSVEKFGPDPVVFIFLGVVFCVTAASLEPKWLIAVVFLMLLILYCWRRDRAEAHEIKMAEMKFKAELAKVQSRKATYRVVGSEVQPALPLNSPEVDGNIG